MALSAYQIQQMGIQGKLTPEILARYNAETKATTAAPAAKTSEQLLNEQNLGMYGGNTELYQTAPVNALVNPVTPTPAAKTTETTPPPGVTNTPAPAASPTYSAASLYDVKNTPYSSGQGTYKSLSDLGIESNPVIDPYTRGLINAGVQKGQMYDIVTNQGYNNEVANRVGIMQGAAEGSANANLGVALTEAEKSMQKYGKVSSSATTRAMVATGEVYAANLASTIAQGTLTIYDQLDQARDSELNRILASGTTQTQEETSRWSTMVAATLDNEKTRINDETNRAIADMQANLQDNIAKIEANTALTGYEKDIQKQAIQIDYQKGKDKLDSELALQLADLDFKKTKYQTDVGASSAQTVAGIYTKSNEVITGLNLAQAEKELVQKAYEFGVTELGSDGKPKWQTLFEQSKIDTADQLELAKDKMEQDKYQFTVTTEEGKREYDANMAWMKDQFATEDAFNKWKAGLDYDIASKNLENNKLATETERLNFQENLSFLKEQAVDENTYKNDSLALSRQVALAQIEDADLTRADSMTQFQANLEYMKEQGAMTDTLQRDLQSQALSAQREQFNITTENGMEQWSKGFNESIRQFNLTNDQQFDLATQQLTLAKEELKGTQDGRELDQIMTIFNNPQVQSYIKTANPDAASQFVEDLLVQAASGEVDFEDTLNALSNPPKDAMAFNDWRDTQENIPMNVAIAEYAKYVKSFEGAA